MDTTKTSQDFEKDVSKRWSIIFVISILSLDKKVIFQLDKMGKNDLYPLRDDTSIIIKEADKRSYIVIWDKKEYVAEATHNLMIKASTKTKEDPLYKVIKKVIRKLRNRVEISHKT